MDKLHIGRSSSTKKSKNSSSSGGNAARKFIPSLRGSNPELARRLARLIKTENHVISAYENASREQTNLAGQLSEWGEETGDDGVSELSDKLGVLLAEIAEQEENLASGMEDSRGVLKQIRNTEQSVQPSRDHKTKINDEIQKLKYKEPSSPKIVELEQELVRAEAQSLVAEAQLANITRQKLRQAYDMQLRALLERSQKQIILAQHARRLLYLLDDTPIVPGETRPPFAQEAELRHILAEAEDELKAWQPTWEELPTSGAQATSAAGVPLGDTASPATQTAPATGAAAPATTAGTVETDPVGSAAEHPQGTVPIAS